jgi:hypothetical protein
MLAIAVVGVGEVEGYKLRKGLSKVECTAGVIG